MIGRITATILLVLSAGILFTSVIRASSITFEFSSDRIDSPASPANRVYIDYPLPDEEGEVAPESLLWPVRAVEDRVRIASASDLQRTDEILAVANKRLVAAEMMFEEENMESSIGFLIRAEQYLARAHEYTRSIAEYPEEDMADKFVAIALCALKHRQVIEGMLVQAPEDARPVIVQTLDISKRVYDEATQEVRKRGFDAPINPFEGAK